MILLFFIFAVRDFQAGASKLEQCPADFSNGSSLECKECSGDLQMKIESHPKWFKPYGNVEKFQMYCTVNKPSNLSVLFYQQNRPRDERGPSPTYLMETEITNCTATVTIEKESVSFCTAGEYICIASDNAGKPLATKSVKFEGLSNGMFYFLPEDGRSVTTNTLIEGQSVKLACAYTKYESTGLEFFQFRRVLPDGSSEMINEVKDKYIWGNKYTADCSNNHKCNVRKLLINDVRASDSGEYICRVNIGRCTLETSTFLKTIRCPTGRHCDAKTGKITPCPAGTFNNQTGVFSPAGCRPCPQNSYCTLASPSPTKCPRMSFEPAQIHDLKRLENKQKLAHCKICPVVPCDKDGRKCTFLCSKSSVAARAGDTARLDCRLSKPILLERLAWLRNNETLSNSTGHEIIRSGESLTLVLHNIVKGHTGYYTCRGVETIMGNTVETTTKLSLLVEEGWNDVTAIIVWVFVACVLSAAIIFAVMRFRKRSNTDQRKLSEECVTESFTDIYLPDRRTMFSRVPSHEYESEPDFDVFICYSCADKVWVRKTLLLNLQDNNLRVCIDFEDFEPGEFIIKNIADAISKSRNTIAVLSPDFVTSDWCQKELKMALSHLHKKHQVIPILYRDCDIPVFLLDRTYLDWCNDDVRETFWEQLVKKVNGGRNAVVATN